ncbi:hypothetical protein L0156_18035 [bacterium]|nr:hypothetical protein [bacterium]
MPVNLIPGFSFSNVDGMDELLRAVANAVENATETSEAVAGYFGWKDSFSEAAKGVVDAVQNAGVGQFESPVDYLSKIPSRDALVHLKEVERTIKDPKFRIEQGLSTFSSRDTEALEALVRKRQPDIPPQDAFRLQSDIPPKEAFRPQTDLPPREAFTKQTELPPKEAFRLQTDVPPKEAFRLQTGDIPPKEAFQLQNSQDIPPTGAFLLQNRVEIPDTREFIDSPGPQPHIPVSPEELGTRDAVDWFGQQMNLVQQMQTVAKEQLSLRSDLDKVRQQVIQRGIA